MTQATKSEWLRVSRTAPCAICDKPDWCTVTADGRTACCMRVESDKPMRNGGWAHALNSEHRTPNVELRRRPPRRETRARFDAEALLAAWGRRMSGSALAGLSARLGVSPDSLRMLGATWANEHRAWAFPMRDGAGNVIGIRLRADNGRKWAVPGSRNGLFWPLGVPGELCDTILICEGLTDTAALLSLEFAAIGRPNCSGGIGLVQSALSRIGRRDVVIVSDTDTPGRMGARRLAGVIPHLARTVRIIEPLQGKDVREWIGKNGATRAVIESVIRNAEVER